MRGTFIGPGGWRKEERRTFRAFGACIPTSHKDRMQMLANANNTHLCCLHQWKFSTSGLIHLQPSNSQGLSLVLLCKQLLYILKVNFTNTLQCVAGGAINHKPISNFVMPYLIRTRSILSPDIHVFKHED